MKNHKQMRAFIGTKNGQKVYIKPNELDNYQDYQIDYRDVLESEIDELEIPTNVYTIKIPFEVYIRSSELQNKLKTIDTTYNALAKTVVGDYLYVGNVDLDYVRDYISTREYSRMKEVGVIFPQEIEELYENEVEGENTPTEE